MLYLRDKQQPYVLREISEGDVLWLLEQLELASADSADFYVARDTVDALSIAGASAALLEGLDGVLDGRAESEVEVVRRLADGSYAPAMIRSANRLEERAAVSTEEAALFEEPRDESEVEIGGRQLLCVVCGAGRFQHRRAQLHSAAATFFGVEWMGPNAECYICEGCGYVHWFVR